jgi:hypothetical protein
LCLAVIRHQKRWLFTRRDEAEAFAQPFDGKVVED